MSLLQWENSNVSSLFRKNHSTLHLKIIGIYLVLSAQETKRPGVSYVVVNPNPEFDLQEGDIM